MSRDYMNSDDLHEAACRMHQIRACIVKALRAGEDAETLRVLLIAEGEAVQNFSRVMQEVSQDNSF